MATPSTRSYDTRTRVFLAVVAVVGVALIAETFLRLEGVIAEQAGELLFATANAVGLVGTLVLAFGEPSERTRRRMVAARRRAAARARTAPATRVPVATWAHAR